MKKSIYPPCLILLVLLLVPVTACTTKTAAEKPQDTPSRQEQPAADVAPRTDDVPAQSAATETAAKTDSGSSQKKPQETTEKPDAVSGATIDSVSGATVTSSAVVGSSQIKSEGWHASAMAIMTRWRIPPESSCG